MPRRADPTNEVHRRKTERWRSRLRELRQPEACHVDIAVAAALSAALIRLQESGAHVPAELQDLIAGTLAVLRSRGFEGRGAAKKLMARLLLRQDRFALLQAVFGTRKHTTTTSSDAAVSPHYSGFRKRKFHHSRSDAHTGENDS